MYTDNGFVPLSYMYAFDFRTSPTGDVLFFDSDIWQKKKGSWHKTYLAVLQAVTNDDRSTRNSITSLRSRSLRASDEQAIAAFSASEMARLR